MEIRPRAYESGPVLAAVFALIVLGAGSLYLTWQSIKHQRSVVEDHMVLSGSVIARGIEGNLMRMMRGLRGSPVMAERFTDLILEYFQEITDSDEIAFVALYGPEGKLAIGSKHQGEELETSMPEVARQEIMRTGSWHGMTTFQSRSVLVVGLPGRPGLARICGVAGPNAQDDAERNGPRGMGQGMGQGMGHGMGMGQGQRHGAGPGPHMERPGNEPPMFFFVGLSAERHMDQFRLFRRAALLQTGYVFGAAVLLWLLAFAYLKRRGQDRRMGRMERFQSKLLDNMPDGLVTLSESGEIMAANPSAMRLLDPNADGQDCSVDGCPVAGRNWSEFPFDDTVAPLGWKQYEYFGRRLELLCVPFQNPDTDTGPKAGDGPHANESRLVLLRDRTEIRTLEDDLEEAKRLATIGSLAAGVAHEVRNPLSSLRGFAQFFADKFKNQKPYEDYAATMVKEADRLNRVVTDLLYLARPRQVAVSSISLDEALESLEKLMRFDLEGKGVTLEKNLQAPEVEADADALTQVLLNLMANALDAVPGTGGRIRISSHKVAGGVRITVEDNGSGFDEAAREKALEPFYTTKNKGTGLGLAIVNTILRAHRGRVTISESDLGGNGENGGNGGAALELFFPHETASQDDQDDREAGNRR